MASKKKITRRLMASDCETRVHRALPIKSFGIEESFLVYGEGEFFVH